MSAIISRNMRRLVSTLAFLVFTLLVGACAPNACALVLDWSTANWTPGDLNNSFDVDGDTVSDITVSITGDTTHLRPDITTGVQTPAITNSLEGGLGPTNFSLQLAADLKTQDAIIVGVSFSAQYTFGVENVSFTIFDIERGTDNERIINIYAIALDGTTQLAGTVSNLGSSVSLSGSGLTQVLTGIANSPDTGGSSGNGNATISFGSQAIRGFFFTFENDSGPPRYQSIGISDISFSPVPEVNPTVGAAAVCLFGILAMKTSRRELRRLLFRRQRNK